MTTFAELGVPARLADALRADGITDPFPVQAATLPDALAGRDICGRAPTGSGKTLGFGIPLMARVSQAEPTKPTGLVLVPTRELAEQVQRAFVPLGRAQWRFVQAIYGGASFGPQIHSLRKGCSVIVATPGRLIDIIEQGYCDLSAVEVCVIDEADRMADLGFMPDVRKILDMTPNTRQTMLWSATLDGDVDDLVNEYLTDPSRHELIDDEDAAPVDHRFVVTRPTDRLGAAAALINEHGPTVVFVKTRFGVDDVAEELNRSGVTAGALHGARSQALRQRTLEDFKRGRIQALVATDVAARGIHVDNVALVLHYDMPDNEKDYTHRSGRTGRAGNAGLVIAFVPPSRQRIAERMSEGVAVDITWERGQQPVESRRNEPRGQFDRRRSNDGDRRDRPVPRDRNDWSPRPRRDEQPTRNDWSPRPRRDERPGSDRPRPRRDDRPASDDRFARGSQPIRRSPDGATGWRERDERPPFARDGQRPPYGRDGRRGTASRGDDAGARTGGYSAGPKRGAYNSAGPKRAGYNPASGNSNGNGGHKPHGPSHGNSHGNAGGYRSGGYRSAGPRNSRDGGGRA